MSSRNMRLLPRATLHSDSEQVALEHNRRTLFRWVIQVITNKQLCSGIDLQRNGCLALEFQESVSQYSIIANTKNWHYKLAKIGRKKALKHFSSKLALLDIFRSA